MENFPFDTVGLCSEEIDRLYDTYKTLKTKFNIEFTGHIDFNLEQFEVFRNYCGVKLRESYAIKQFNNDSYALFVELHSRSQGRHGGINDSYENQTWALAYLKKDFGRVLIRRETLADKIIELVHPVELDFEDDKAFSDTFYVLVNDYHKAVSAIDRNFRNAVMDVRHENFTIEVIEHTLIVGDRQPMSPGRAVYLAEFVARLSSLC